MNPSSVAIVVVLPEPVGPVTRIRPRRVSANDRITVGNDSSSKVRSSGLTHRIASPTVSDCRKTLTRNRPTPSIVYAKSASRVRANSSALCGGINASANCRASVGVSSANGVGSSSPSTLMKGTLPAFRWTSLARRSTAYRSSSAGSIPETFRTGSCGRLRPSGRSLEHAGAGRGLPCSDHLQRKSANCGARYAARRPAS